eukprot:1730981-Pyramimonas_sp.AAC.1
MQRDVTYPPPGAIRGTRPTSFLTASNIRRCVHAADPRALRTRLIPCHTWHMIAPRTATWPDLMLHAASASLDIWLLLP